MTAPKAKHGKKAVEADAVTETGNNLGGASINHELDTHFEEYEMSKMPGS